MSTTISQQFALLADKAEATLKDQSARSPVRIQVGSATCEHAAGADEVFDEFRKHVAASGRNDILLHRTGCTGRCSREPIVGVFVPGQMPVKYERVDRNLVHEIFTRHVLGGQPGAGPRARRPARADRQYEILICGSDRCGWQGRAVVRNGSPPRSSPRPASPRTTCGSRSGSCFGACNSGDERQPLAHARAARQNPLPHRERGRPGRSHPRAHSRRPGRSSGWRSTARRSAGSSSSFTATWPSSTARAAIALRHNGVLDPESIEEYFHYRGFQALAKVLEKGDPQWVIDEITQSKLRGRGGGGFPTGQKWAMAAEAQEKTRYLICNADEGDPGAFMDRSMLESDPLNVVEGMIIGGYAIGAQRGFFYVRAEYPMAIRRIQHAIDQCRALGPAGQEHPRLGLRFRPGDPPGRRGLRLRRRDGPDPFDRRRARPAADPPALSRPRAACGASRR